MKRSNVMFVLFLLGTLSLLLSSQNCSPLKPYSAQTSSLASLDGRYNDPANNPALMCSTADPGQALLRKLSNEELANSLMDILSINSVDTKQLPSDVSSSDGFTNNASFLKVSPLYLYELVNIIETSVNTASVNNGAIFSCTTSMDLACAKKLIQDFGRKAYRRSLTTVEVDQLASIVTSQQSAGVDFRGAVGIAYQRILLSPYFLYRTSFGKSGTASTIALLSPHEYVTRLSYFLWNSPPDERLLGLADRDGLNTTEAVRVEIIRMLKDPKAQRFNASFVGQWLGTKAMPDDFAIRTGLSLQTQRNMRRETEMFTSSIFQGNGAVVDLIAGDYTFLNADLAGHYGIPNISGTEFRRVSLAGTPRRGVLTQGSFLTLSSADARTKPTGRGNAILQNITCTPPPPFPDGVAVTPLDETNTSGMTIKQQLAVHNRNPACAACHVEMDPVGLGLENFDQFGKFRTNYPNGMTVDPSGILHNKAFGDSTGLLEIIREENNFKRCITKKLMTYAVGRSLTAADQCAVNQIGDKTIIENKSFIDLVLAIVVSEQFRMNRTDSWGN